MKPNLKLAHEWIVRGDEELLSAEVLSKEKNPPLHSLVFTAIRQLNDT